MPQNYGRHPSDTFSWDGNSGEQVIRHRISMLSQSLVIRAGWLSMLVAIMVPFCMSMVAAAKFRGPACFTNGVYFGFAPLIAVCKPVGLFWTTAGWLFTTITVIAYLGAVLAGAVATWRAVRSTPRTRLVPPVFLLVLTGVVTAAILFAIASSPHIFAGSGALTFVASGAALIAYVAIALTRAIVEVAAAVSTRHR